MIRRHDFNSEWTGQSAGIVSDDSFFELPAAARADLLSEWDWVEARGSLSANDSGRREAAGFSAVDTQIQFKLGLKQIPTSPSADRLAVQVASVAPFEVRATDIADFRHERFAALPGMTAELLNRRFAMWSGLLIDRDPSSCLQITAGDEVQGWFLSERSDAGLTLALAMLSADAHISGHLLYQRALLTYRDQGARVGHAGFSVTNTPVHNIYSALGARFLAPIGCWLWHS